MIDPSLPIHEGVYAALKAAAPLAQACGGVSRVYDRVPPNPVFPYLVIGAVDAQGYQGGGCLNMATTDVLVTVWSRAADGREAKRIAAAAAAALDAPIAVAGHRVNLHAVESVSHDRTSDGLTYVSAIAVRYGTTTAL